MSLTVLSVAYPLAPVGPDSVGGAEQVLYQLDAALTAAGYRSVVVACEGSDPTGTLIAIPRPGQRLGEREQAQAHSHVRHAIVRALRDFAIDLVHMHGCDFHAYLPAGPAPVLATLHLPVALYPPAIFHSPPPHLRLHCVSAAQHRDCPECPHLLPPVENGVPAQLFSARHAKRSYALVMGRICPEKGVHLAVDAAKRADVPLLIAGEIFPYESHIRYFETEVEPRLDAHRRFIGPVGFARKRRLLAGARCVLIPSLIEETSSLVAREALACGTPVIAFPNGALRDAIDPDRTGFLVTDMEAMAAAIRDVGRLNPNACRASARTRFSSEAMLSRYLAMYDDLACLAPTRGVA